MLKEGMCRYFRTILNRIPFRVDRVEVSAQLGCGLPARLRAVETFLSSVLLISVRFWFLSLPTDRPTVDFFGMLVCVSLWTSF